VFGQVFNTVKQTLQQNAASTDYAATRQFKDVLDMLRDRTITYAIMYNAGKIEGVQPSQFLLENLQSVLTCWRAYSDEQQTQLVTLYQQLLRNLAGLG